MALRALWRILEYGGKTHKDYPDQTQYLYKLTNQIESSIYKFSKTKYNKKIFIPDIRNDLNFLLNFF